MHPRYLEEQVKQDLQRKMVFIGGPRQVGKTTMAKNIVQEKGSYLNWDISEHREKILNHEIPTTEFLFFDEIHKYKSWRDYLKGIFDEWKDSKNILVTGSARLDFYRRGGDSLQGRYYYLRLYPLSFSELNMENNDDLRELLHLGGFPEPFFSSSDIETKRWSREYRTRLINEDLLSLESIKDIGNLELTMLRLPELVGSPLSINSISKKIQVSHKTIANWLHILERLYTIFRLPPFGAPKIRAVKKEQKHYHFDWTLVKDRSLAFENLVALHLLKWVGFRSDTLGEDMELRYFRDIDGREVDFVVMREGKPIQLIECKWNDADISKGLKYLKERYPDSEAYQISATGNKDFISKHQIRVCPANIYLATLI